ncbi:phage tail protein [Marivivens aquimaris]|uniref:phage tail protein n=1 Tax=Marivivens aquimaris TaxID=2774876 RepID=UPI00187EC224|nr:phage tail protein [Marivivens aquimaris]
MLMTIGLLQFKVQPLALAEFSRTFGADYASKPVVGAAPVLEYVGPAATTFSLSAKLYPHNFGDGASIAILQQIVASGNPQYMIRGDGALFGWVVIDNVTEGHSQLAENGVGHIVDVDLSLIKSGPPDGGLYYSVMSQLFG